MGFIHMGVNRAKGSVVEIAGFVGDGWCACCCVCFNVDGNELTVGVDEVLMFGAGVLFDLFVELADVGGGNGGVATKSSNGLPLTNPNASLKTTATTTPLLSTPPIEADTKKPKPKPVATPPLPPPTSASSTNKSRCYLVHW
jgi:hypothetical protein